jgi:hypothetical protein
MVDDTHRIDCHSPPTMLPSSSAWASQWTFCRRAKARSAGGLATAGAPVIERVENLEKMVESLVEIPQRMTAVEGRVGSLELQIVQLRNEMRDGFSAVRAEAKRANRRLMRGLLQVIDASSRATQVLFQETQNQMRVLHEDLVSRIARIGEARAGRRSRKTPAKH